MADRARTGLLLVAVAALAGCGSADRTSPAPRDTGTVVFAEGFEDGTLGGWDEVQRARPGSISIVGDRAREGARAARFELRDGDHIDGEEASRAELVAPDDPLGAGDEREYRWSTFVPARYPRSERWQVIAQWKNEGTGSPPLELDLLGDDVVLSAQAGGKPVELGRAPLARGRWLDFRVRIRFAERARDAAIDVWYRGRRMVRRRGVATLYPGRTSYFKLGLYRDGAITATAALYHDALEVRRP